MSKLPTLKLYGFDLFTKMMSIAFVFIMELHLLFDCIFIFNAKEIFIFATFIMKHVYFLVLTSFLVHFMFISNFVKS